MAVTKDLKISRKDAKTQREEGERGEVKGD